MPPRKSKGYLKIIDMLLQCSSILALCLVMAVNSLLLPLNSSQDPSDSLIENFSNYMRFARSAGCNQTWNLSGSTFPNGSLWDIQHPTRIIKSVYSPNLTGAGFVAVNDDLKSIITTFRGSATRNLWLQDFKFWVNHVEIIKVKPAFIPRNINYKDPNMSKMLIHFGFQQLYMELREDIQTTLRSLALLYPDYRIVFAGHSLGSALALIAAVDFGINPGGVMDRIELYLYATPRVGNTEWAQYVDSLSLSSKGYRIVKYGDPVPHLPPMFVGYRHSFQQYSILEDNSIQPCKKYNEKTSDCEYNDFVDTVHMFKANLHADDSYLKYFNETFVCEGVSISQ